MDIKIPLMVGYLESWGQLTFTQAAKSGYTAIVMAFGEIEIDQVGIFDGQFAPSPTPEALKTDIANAKGLGAETILFSVGGANNTYNPNGCPVSTLAENIVTFLREYGFTGIDFDLEIDGDISDEEYLDQLCFAIRRLDETVIITAAPQLNQADHATDLYLVSTANCRMYDLAVKNQRFDYLFIQAYNNPWPMIDNCKETDIGFISKSFENLKKSIPAETLIVIGEPADKNGAGTSIFTANPNIENIYSQIHDQYQSIAGAEQFGGAMTWDINWDSKNDYQFVKSVKNAFL